MIKIRTAVVGTGYLGKYHVEKHACLEQSELVAVCDVDPKAARRFAKKYNCLAISDYRELLGKVDAVCIATPTHTHHKLGKFFLENGIHVLMEKPITATIKEADELISIAARNKLKLQVGHLERFNPAIKHIQSESNDLRFIESTRLAPFNPRGTDVNVILDLMIHDIDLIQYLVKSPIIDIRANGASVISKTADITNARIEFESGCVANVTASRVSLKTERRMRIFKKDGYISINLHEPETSIIKRGKGNMAPGIPNVSHKGKKFPKNDAILEETSNFFDAILHDTPLAVPGEDGRTALAAALQITDVLHQSKQWNLDRETV
ncbi:MAG: UDP-N-acetyl-D-glucosamine dehydrogenase [Coxiella sp. (in: Bacteria)]|nr:MAG: UDP-N-acetyl-D-glucosamine dehydrogenase [Coxiella sp. (in: g-proteobacteria)]